MQNPKFKPLNITPNLSQSEALKLLRQHWKKERRFLVYAPTGSGKTGLASFMINGFAQSGLRCMFVAPYTILIDQTALRLHEYGLDLNEVSIMWRDDPRYDPTLPIQIASGGTLSRRARPDNVDVVIVDECHLKNTKIVEWAEACPEVYFIGLSATPFAKWLGRVYNRLLKPVSLRQLFENGDLCKYIMFNPEIPDLTGVKSSKNADGIEEYNEEQIAAIMGGAKLVGDAISWWLEAAENRSTICFCQNVSHANYVCIEFNNAGVSAEVMDANTPKDQRAQTIARYESGATKVIVNCGVLVAGFDSKVQCVMLDFATKSPMKYLQTIGRGLRNESGKTECLIADFGGNSLRLGMPEDVEIDDLYDDQDPLQVASHKAAEKEKYIKLPKPCPRCKFTKPAGIYVCPHCGHKPLHGEVADQNDNKKITRATKKKKIEPTAEDKQAFYSELLGYQNMRRIEGKPVKDGYIAYTFKDRYGHWPNNLERSATTPTAITLNYIKSKNIKAAKARAKGL